MAAATRTYSQATDRWAGIGPYYAMFPVRFADAVIRSYTELGDGVLDPFAGRGTAVFSAAAQGRRGLGVEVNPVGWVYSRAKLRPALERLVVERLDAIAAIADQYDDAANELPAFFRACFAPGVLRFLVAARAQLDWRRRATDWTLAGLLLVYLHGKREASLSNQMRQTKALSPDYAVHWWRERALVPPDVDPVSFMRQRISWRYARGRPTLTRSVVYLDDSLRRLPALLRDAGDRTKNARLLLTSPPYHGVTNYHYDQWLRLWLLGGPPTARRQGGRNRGKFEHRPRYRALLHDIFALSSRLLSPDAAVYVRTDARPFTLDTTRDALVTAFPDKRLFEFRQPFVEPTQTALFGDRERKQGEIDLVLLPAGHKPATIDS